MKHEKGYFKAVFTTFEVANFCGVTMAGVIRWVESGKLKAYKTPGGHRRISRPDLMAFMFRYGLPIPSQLSDGQNPENSGGFDGLK